MRLSNHTSEDDKLDALCLWIRANANKQIGWGELSKVSNLSHTNLIRLFRKINTTPMSFIRRIKDEEKFKGVETVFMTEAFSPINGIDSSRLHKTH